jgi:hypothetical protein
MIVYKIAVCGSVQVSKTAWPLLKWLLSWLTGSRKLETFCTARLYVLRIGKVKLDEGTEWRIARDLNLCPRCGKRLRRYFSGPDICYECTCGFYDEMDIS